MGFWENQIVKQVFNNIGSNSSAIRLPNHSAVIRDEYLNNKQLMLNIHGNGNFQIDLVYRENNWFAILTSGGNKNEVPVENRKIIDLDLPLSTKADLVADELRYLVRSLQEKKFQLLTDDPNQSKL